MINNTSHLKIDLEHASKDNTQVRHILDYGHRVTLNVIQYDSTFFFSSQSHRAS